MLGTNPQPAIGSAYNTCTCTYMYVHAQYHDCTYQLDRFLSSLKAQVESVFVRLILDLFPSFTSSLMEVALLNNGRRFLPNEEQRSLYTNR